VADIQVSSAKKAVKFSHIWDHHLYTVFAEGNLTEPSGCMPAAWGAFFIYRLCKIGNLTELSGTPVLLAQPLHS